MSKKIRTEAVDSLFEAILSLQDKEECYAFFEDVCTVNELLSLSQRFEVAKMLREKRTYLEIAEKTGASTATVSYTHLTLPTKRAVWFVSEDTNRTALIFSSENPVQVVGRSDVRSFAFSGRHRNSACR